MKTTIKNKSRQEISGFDEMKTTLPKSTMVMMNRLINLSVCKAGLVKW